MKLTLSKKMYGLVGIMSLIMIVGTAGAVLSVRWLLGHYETLVRVDVARYSASMESEVALAKAVLATKNYMTRMDSESSKAFTEEMGKLKEQIKGYAKLAKTREEREILKKVEAELGPYEQKGKEMLEATMSGKDPMAVDSLYSNIEVPLFKVLREMGQSTLNTQNRNFEKDATMAKSGQWLLVVGLLIGIGMAWAVAALTIRKILKSVFSLSEVTVKASEGDLSQDVPVLTDDEVGRMAQGFNRMMGDLRRIAGEIKGMTNTLASSSEQVSATTEVLAKGAKDQSHQTEQTAAAITEVSQTVMDVAKNAAEASNSSKEMSRIAEEGRKKVEDTVAGMHGIAGTVKESANTVGELGKASKEIGAIINTINDIADQTNLLALNAAIEAARAGESGRGFAVVADEVRKLAERTGKATKEIAAMIEKIQEETALSVSGMQTGIVEVEKGVALAEEARSALERIVAASAVSTDMIQRIATAAEEQSAATEQMSSNMEGIADITRQTESSIEQIRVTVADLSRMAAQLNDSASWFRT
ncbi:MAG: methyl-accepting chemotaxis protein [Thermodesulfobacteriota bacterium]